VAVHRREIYEAVRAANREAVITASVAAPRVAARLRKHLAGPAEAADPPRG
jgi:sRNA-binding carbon storage regulator CsrA